MSSSFATVLQVDCPLIILHLRHIHVGNDFGILQFKDVSRLEKGVISRSEKEVI